jgi:hypothetical protein
MTTRIKIKKGAGTPSGLTFGELAYDVTNKKLFIGITGGNALLANTDGGVASFNGLTGAIGLSAGTGITFTISGNTLTIASSGGGGGVALGDTNIWTALNTFNAGISAAGGVTLAGTFSGATGSFSKLTTFNSGLSGDINISTTNASGNVMYLLMARGTGVTGVFIDNVTTPLIYNPFQGNLGLKGITLSTGVDSLSILPGSVTANNSTNNAYFYFIANGGNYFQSPTLSAIGDIGAVNSAMCLNVDPSLRTMTWGDGVYLTGVTSGFFGVNRNSYGMLSDYAVEINSPTGKGIQLMYNDYTGAVSNSVKMDVSSTGNYTVLPSGGLATITGRLNVSAGISAAGATFSAPITSTRMARHTSAAISAIKTASFSPTAAEDGTVFYINYAGKAMYITLESLPIGWRAKFFNTGGGNVVFETPGDIYGNGLIGLGDSMMEAICIGSETYFVG